jgi:hypothetical protein
MMTNSMMKHLLRMMITVVMSRAVSSVFLVNYLFFLSCGFHGR